jgi:hypothetical protein
MVPVREHCFVYQVGRYLSAAKVGRMDYLRRRKT